MTAVRLVIVTNCPDEACIQLLHRDPLCLPYWIAIAADPVAVMRIASGQKCIGYFNRTANRNKPDAVELAWFERRMSPDFVAGLTAEEFDKLYEWRDRKQPPEPDRADAPPGDQQRPALARKWS